MELYRKIDKKMETTIEGLGIWASGYCPNSGESNGKEHAKWKLGLNSGL